MSPHPTGTRARRLPGVFSAQTRRSSLFCRGAEAAGKGARWKHTFPRTLTKLSWSERFEKMFRERSSAAPPACNLAAPPARLTSSRRSAKGTVLAQLCDGVGVHSQNF